MFNSELIKYYSRY